MTFLFDLDHPAHVHLFRNMIGYLRKNDFQVIVTSREKDVTKALLDHYQIPHIPLSKSASGLLNLAVELLKRDMKTFSLHLKHRFVIAFGTSTSIAHLSALTKMKSYVFEEDDDDVVPLFCKITYPFCTGIVVPDCLRFDQWKEKRIIHNSYHELAYLHPNHFTADPKVLATYKLKPYEYIIYRKSALKAHHDTHVKGIDRELWLRIQELCHGFRIIGSFEDQQKTEIAPWDMHQVMAFAKLMISDSQTMTAEAAVLGVPSLRINSFVGKINYLEELEQRYDLTYGFIPGNERDLISKLQELLSKDALNQEWQIKRQKMLCDKTDLTQWMIQFLNQVKN